MLRKKEVYTNITPIPAHIPRRLTLDILHSHEEVIKLNPLVLECKKIPAPREASAEEYYSTWYEITERIQYIPGMGNMGSGKIQFKGVFHDLDWGLQSHIYAPMNIDMRNKYRICGNQPGEPLEKPELGIDAPKEGLYLREDIEFKCNITMISFVKSQMKAASLKMIDRFIKKAELLDAGVLHAMMEDGKLKTVNPADHTGSNRNTMNFGQSSSQISPSPSTGSSQPYNYPHSPVSPYWQQQPQYPGASPHQVQQSWQSPPQSGAYLSPNMPQQGFAMELPGDYPAPGNNPQARYSQPSYPSDIKHASYSPNPNQYPQQGYNPNYNQYPYAQQQFAAELPSQPVPSTNTYRHSYNGGGSDGALKQLEGAGRDSKGPYQAYRSLQNEEQKQPGHQQTGHQQPPLQKEFCDDLAKQEPPSDTKAEKDSHRPPPTYSEQQK